MINNSKFLRPFKLFNHKDISMKKLNASEASIVIGGAATCSTAIEKSTVGDAIVCNAVTTCKTAGKYGNDVTTSSHAIDCLPE